MDFTPASWKKLVISSPGFLLGIKRTTASTLIRDVDADS